jgi:ACS family hexuronate transporter-like MFS transporter
MLTPAERRWIGACVLYLSSALNYLDRSILSALAPTIIREFQIDKEHFGYIISALSITYAFSAPLMGLLIDRIGLTIGAAAVVGGWSLVGMATGWVTGFSSLLFCRAALGVVEAGGIPAAGKASAVFLEPKHRALGSAISQVGLTIGLVAAPVMTAYIEPRYGWRFVFVLAGALGFVWIPLWLAASRLAPVLPVDAAVRRVSSREMLRDRRFLGLIIANILAMTVYSLWTNWVTLFLASSYGLPQNEVNARYAWIPPNFASLGGLFGGWFALRLIRSGSPIIGARLRISLYSALMVLATAAAPLMPTPALATAAICLSFFSVTCLSVNYYSIPLDIFGADRAAFGVSALTGAFGLMQFFLSPVIGRWADQFGWQPMCVLVAICPLLSYFVLRMSLKRA